MPQHFANAVVPEKCFLFGLNGNPKIYKKIPKGFCIVFKAK